MLSLLYSALRNLIAPPLCAICKIFLSERSSVCPSCKDKIHPIVSTAIAVTATCPMTVLAVSAYQEPLKGLILSKSRSYIVGSNQLGHLVWELTNIRNMPCDYLVPIPLHWTRFAKRGYNQAEEMARVVSQYNGKPVANILKRVKRTQFQAALAHQERADNVAEAFELVASDMSIYKDKHLVLVDDLMTTGATLRVAARELMKLKPASITAVVACRVV
jgi:ComF family protein